jgi:hypothetical protein
MRMFFQLIQQLDRVWASLLVHPRRAFPRFHFKIVRPEGA